MKEVDTMTEKKMTKREYINRILSYAHDEDREYLEHELELLDRKNSAERKPTAKQTENAGIKTTILGWMEPDVQYVAADVVKNCPACEGLSAQRVSAMLTQLVNDGAIVKVVDKRKSFYSLA